MGLLLRWGRGGEGRESEATGSLRKGKEVKGAEEGMEEERKGGGNERRERREDMWSYTTYC